MDWFGIERSLVLVRNGKPPTGSAPKHRFGSTPPWAAAEAFFMLSPQSGVVWGFFQGEFKRTAPEGSEVVGDISWAYSGIRKGLSNRTLEREAPRKLKCANWSKRKPRPFGVLLTDTHVGVREIFCGWTNIIRSPE